MRVCTVCSVMNLCQMESRTILLLSENSQLPIAQCNMKLCRLHRCGQTEIFVESNFANLIKSIRLEMSISAFTMHIDWDAFGWLLLHWRISLFVTIFFSIPERVRSDPMNTKRTHMSCHPLCILCVCVCERWNHYKLHFICRTAKTNDGAEKNQPSLHE